MIERGHSIDLLTGYLGEPPALIATDPPYAMGGEGAEHAVGAVVAVALRESARLLRPGGWMICFAAASWRSTYYMIEAVRGVVEPKRIATWAKPSATTRAKSPGWAWSSVNVIAFHRSGKGDLPPLAPSREPDFIVCPPERVGRRAVLPAEVAGWAVRPYAVPGAVMLDPFAGAGTLLAAAAESGMTTRGFEMQKT